MPSSNDSECWGGQPLSILCLNPKVLRWHCTVGDLIIAITAVGKFITYMSVMTNSINHCITTCSEVLCCSTLLSDDATTIHFLSCSLIAVLIVLLFLLPLLTCRNSQSIQSGCVVTSAIIGAIFISSAEVLAPYHSDSIPLNHPHV